MITNKIDVAAYLNAIDFKIGLITKGEDGLANIEIEGDEEAIQKAIDDYNSGAKVNAKKFYDSLGFVRYIINKK